MKLVFSLLLIFLFVNTAKSQVDTVCYNSLSSSTYQVANVPGDTYTWSVSSPGIITNGQGTNAITVNWGTATPGLITNAVSVFATNSFGCVSPPVDIDVFVLNIIPTIAPINLCVNAPCVTLLGTPTGGIWSGVGVSGNQFCPFNAGVGSTQITYTYSIGGCSFSTVTTAVVNPLPSISPIQHN
jgi:hypothetical protein